MIRRPVLFAVICAAFMLVGVVMIIAAGGSGHLRGVGFGFVVAPLAAFVMAMLRSRRF